MSAIYWEADQGPFPKCIVFVRKAVNVVCGFVSYVYYLSCFTGLVMKMKKKKSGVPEI